MSRGWRQEADGDIPEDELVCIRLLAEAPVSDDNTVGHNTDVTGDVWVSL